MCVCVCVCSSFFHNIHRVIICQATLAHTRGTPNLSSVVTAIGELDDYDLEYSTACTFIRRLPHLGLSVSLDVLVACGDWMPHSVARALKVFLEAGGAGQESDACLEHVNWLIEYNGFN